MKKLLILSLLLLPVCFASIQIEVLKVYDGNTIKIRLQGIDCYKTSKIHRAYKQAYLKNLQKNSTAASFDFMGWIFMEECLG